MKIIQAENTAVITERHTNMKFAGRFYQRYESTISTNPLEYDDHEWFEASEDYDSFSDLSADLQEVLEIIYQEQKEK